MHSPLEYVSDSVYTNPLIKISAGRKLADGVYHFSTLPGCGSTYGGKYFVGTCSQNCPGCYARGMLYTTMRGWTYRTEWARNDMESLFSRICNQVERILSRSNRLDLRFHVSGDFFSQEYINAVAELVKFYGVRGMRSYSYTGNECRFDFSQLINAKHFNLVRSVLPDGERNFGTVAEIEALKSKYATLKLDICPKNYIKGWDGKCGTDCRKCWVNPYMAFALHGSTPKVW